jgi:hypothetical protein
MEDFVTTLRFCKAVIANSTSQFRVNTMLVLLETGLLFTMMGWPSVACSCFMKSATQHHSPHLYSGHHSLGRWMARQPDFFSHLTASQEMSGGRHTHRSHRVAVGMGSSSLYRTSSETHTANRNQKIVHCKRTSRTAATSAS